MRLVFLLCLTLGILSFSASEKAHVLSKELKEISGWVFVNDSTLVAHNDSGDHAKLYVLNKEGKILHRVKLTNVDNIDMEDITYDGNKYLYIGDFGNNLNKRKDLAIYKVEVNQVLNNEDTPVEIIHFNYPEQTSFPPANEYLYYDCEALAYANDSLWLFTKNRTSPFDGKCIIYKLPVKPGTYEASYHNFIIIGKRDWYRDAVTAADIRGKKLFLLTYNRFIYYSFHHGKIKYIAHEKFTGLTQKEALTVAPDSKIFIADERHKMLGGGHIYEFNEPQKKKKK